MGPRSLATLAFALALATAIAGLAADGVEGASTSPTHQVDAPPLYYRDLAEDYSIRVWRQTDGLPSDRVRCVLPSRDGYVWVGTAAGLGRFDGLRWVRFDQGNVPLLTDHRIRGLAEDGDGDLWIATEDLQGLVFGGGGWSIPDFPGTDWAILHDIADARDGSVFFWSTRGWLRSRRDRETSTGVGSPGLEPIPGMSGDTVGVGNAPDGRRVRVEREAFILEAADGRTLERHAIRPRPASANFTAAVASTPDGAVWALTGVADRPEGFDLWRWSPGAFRHVDDAAPQPRRTFLTSDGARGVWHCAESGRVAHTTPERRTRYALPSSRAEVFALDVATAADGGIWIAVENGGLLQLRPRRIEAIRPPGGGKRAMVRSVLPEDSGVVWAGTDDGVIRVTADASKGGWAVEPAGLEGQSVRSLARDPGGILWAGTGRGLYADRGSGWRPVDLPKIAYGASDGDGFGSIKVRDLLARGDGSLWIASAHQVAAVPGRGQAPVTLAFVPSLVPADLMEDRAGCVWLATEKGGVFVLGDVPTESVISRDFAGVPGLPADRWRFAPRNWLRQNQGLPVDNAWELYEDRDGTIWIAGSRGVVRLQADTAKALRNGLPVPSDSAAAFVFTTRQGLPELAMNGVTEDDDGYLWFGGDRGVYRTARTALRAAAGNPASRPVIESWTTSDGLPADETNGRLSHPGATRDREGRIWMATVGGLACFPKRAGTASDHGPRVAIEEVRADGSVLATTLPQDPEGGPIRVEGALTEASAAPAVLRRLTRPEVIRPGRGRVIEVHFTGFDDAAPRDLRFRYQLEGYDARPQEIGDRRVAYFTNLDPGRYRFRVWAAGSSGVWSTVPANFEFTLRPRVWQTLWFRTLAGASLIGLALAAAARRIRQVRRMEQLRRREEGVRLRDKLARDLHDGVGSGLARLALLADLPTDESATPDRVSRQLRELSGAVRDLAQTVREISWNANPSSISLEHLVAQIADQAVEFLGAAGIPCRTRLPLDFPNLQLSPDQRSHLYFAAKEAVTNIVRHASATEATFDVVVAKRDLVLTLHDNGRGLSVVSPSDAPARAVPAPHRVGNGHGLPNLHARVAALGGRLVLDGKPGIGTTVRIEVPLDRLGARETDAE